jgi:hypothetical protein
MATLANLLRRDESIRLSSCKSAKALMNIE